MPGFSQVEALSSIIAMQGNNEKILDEDSDEFLYFEDDNKDRYFKPDQIKFYERHYKPELKK
jgi:hypothetical protein